ncbi:MAG TPA: alpha/beta hydrolase fold domain-containing protein [Pirellulales bacterium]|jgi:predicted esterase|nr:alpha/beta hydrolase fold domain-containing protein [Pirellulales bacterium]
MHKDGGFIDARGHVAVHSPHRGQSTRFFLARWLELLSTVATIAIFLWSAEARADKFTLQDGRVLEGRFSRLNTMIANPGIGQASMPTTKLVDVIDNDLCRTYIPEKFIQHPEATPAGQHFEEIDIPQAVATAGQRISGVGNIIQITKWDDDGFGRRTFSMTGGPTGRVDVVQGITKITPLWCSVEGLQVTHPPSYIWDMRIATSSIPQETLSKIIGRHIDPKKVDDRLKVVRLYLQAERYKEAEAELNEVLKQFPERDNLKEVAHDIQQLGAKQALQEIDIRQQAGQYQFAFNLLNRFPSEGVEGQILQQVKSKLEESTEQNEHVQTITKQLTDLIAQLPDSALRARMDPIVREISEELSPNTLDRMATYRRFADDPQNSSPSDSKLALAISGWLLGAGDASENLQVALATMDLRNLIETYLQESVKLKRDDLLSKIQAQDSATPKLLAALIAHMKPNVHTPLQGAPGFYELSVPGLQDEADVNYCVQLPPEYDPHASYPCIVTLHGGATTSQQQIDWWAGPQVKHGGETVRAGQAGRYGYIVIAPEWAAPHQTQYEASVREHNAVLASLRDACRRFAIDSDRVFLSGHSAGGNAAWDIGLAHPDLWAGLIPIVATANSTVQRYWKNAAELPLYFVCGELDGDKMVKNGPEFDRYMNRSAAFDCTVVEFEGRGHENFSDEILRLFDWMGRKRRNFFPHQFTTVSERPFDNFFWWLELRNFQPNDKLFTFESNLTANNGLSIHTNGKVTIWLAPEMVDFSRPITIMRDGARLTSPNNIKPEISVLLEDVRTRGDRRHPFWAKVE